jgi:hypothetical protein
MFYGYMLKTKYKILCSHFWRLKPFKITLFWKFFIFISLFGENSPAKKRASRLLTIVTNLVGPVATLMLGT